jgi:hypothetical protein
MSSVPQNPVLDRLEEIAARGPGNFIARCPAHDDRRPSLSVRILDDGRTLVHCWAGCAAADIVHAVGLELSDLFPLAENRGGKNSVIPPYRDLLRLLARETWVVRLAAERIATGEKLDIRDIQRVRKAHHRIDYIAGVAR